MQKLRGMKSINILRSVCVTTRKKIQKLGKLESYKGLESYRIIKAVNSLKKLRAIQA